MARQFSLFVECIYDGNELLYRPLEVRGLTAMEKNNLNGRIRRTLSNFKRDLQKDNSTSPVCPFDTGWLKCNRSRKEKS